MQRVCGVNCTSDTDEMEISQRVLLNQLARVRMLIADDDYKVIIEQRHSIELGRP